jgi:transcriptional regulator with XRE-family HTH domain
MDNAGFNKELATSIEMARVSAGISQNQLASATLIPQSTLHRKLQGIGSFSVDELVRIGSHLGVSPTALWPGESK